MSENKMQRLLTVEELSDRTNLPQWRIYELIAKGKAPPTHVAEIKLSADRVLRVRVLGDVVALTSGHVEERKVREAQALPIRSGVCAPMERDV